MNNAPTLWSGADPEVPQLRPPKCLPQAVTQNSRQLPVVDKNNAHATGNSQVQDTNQLKHLEEILSKSVLNPEARVWQPSFVYRREEPTEIVTKSVQDRLNKIWIGSDDDTRVKPNMFNPSIQSTSDSEDLDTKRLKQIITTLTRDPGQFDDLLGIFIETFSPHLDDILFLSMMAQVLVEQAISNPNFRYSGARLCWYVEQNCPGFRAELHLRCKKQLEENINTQNVVLFVAELYTQLPHLTVYGALLVDSYKRLLANGGDNNIKCLCQALKLTGYSLESSNKADLNEVFKQLESIKCSVTGSAAILLASVLNLRLLNWGHTAESSNESDQDSDEFMYEAVQNAVFYQPDGNTLTHEESEFIAAHLHSNEEYLSDNSDPDDLCDPEPEMDEEIQLAFKEFVKLSSKQ